MVDEIFIGEIKTVKANDKSTPEVFKKKIRQRETRIWWATRHYRYAWIREWIICWAKKKQRGIGLKILTPDQMLSRLPITLAQLKTGNNSKNL